MVLVVLDTNVLIAGFRSWRGASFGVLTLLGAGAFEIALSVPLVLEYEAVLRLHAAERGWSARDVSGLVDYLCRVGRHQTIHFLWRPKLRDAADEFILELAVAARCDAIVTHTVRDFAAAETFGIKVVTPAAFITELEQRP